MNCMQCDSCGRTDAPEAAGWLCLLRYGADMVVDGIFGCARPAREHLGTFCCSRCLADYTYLMAVTEPDLAA